MTGQKENKNIRRKSGVTLMRTKSGFRVKIKTLEPMIFQELRDKYNIVRKGFVYTHTSEETGAVIEFPYTPPEEAPVKENGLEEWERYHMFLQWQRDYERDYAAYRHDANNLMLAKAVTIVGWKHGKKHGNWEKYFASDKWTQPLIAGGVEITPVNRFLLFLKSEVFGEQEYLTALNEATVEEVSLGDVLRALDYFRSVLRRNTDFSDFEASGGDGEARFLAQLLGIPNDVGDGDATESVVQVGENGEGGKVSS